MWATTYLSSDVLGSVVAEVSASAAVTERTRYQPFGAPTSPRSGPGYTGHVMDRGGLIYMQGRYYDPDVGRFLGMDPVAPSLADGGDFNRYAYARNNPYRYTDSTGQYVETAWDLVNVGIGLRSFGANVSEGNWGGAALDAVGVVVDGLAVATPLPGGVGTAIHMARAADAVVDAGRVADTAATAAKGVAGFAPGAAETALTGMRNGGGHAIRHLEGTLIPNTGSLQSRVDAFKVLATPILENPLHATNWRIGATEGRAFLGNVNGNNLVIVVAKDGPHQGNLERQCSVVRWRDPWFPRIYRRRAELARQQIAIAPVAPETSGAAHAGNRLGLGHSTIDQRVGGSAKSMARTLRLRRACSPSARRTGPRARPSARHQRSDRARPKSRRKAA